MRKGKVWFGDWVYRPFRVLVRSFQNFFFHRAIPFSTCLLISLFFVTISSCLYVHPFCPSLIILFSFSSSFHITQISTSRLLIHLILLQVRRVLQPFPMSYRTQLRISMIVYWGQPWERGHFQR
jgi:hypothetical protein